MKFKHVQFKRKLLSGVMCSSMFLSFSHQAMSEEVYGDASKFKLKKGEEVSETSKTGLYIVQLKGKPGIAKAQELGELLPKNQWVSTKSNRYNATSAKMQAYHRTMEQQQQKLAKRLDDIKINYSYKHTFNGFSARLTAKQKIALQSSAEVIGVWEDVMQQPSTANTPAFLGLTGSGGQHELGILGEDVVIGIVDTGIWPEHPSFAGEGYGQLTSWNGSCDIGEDPDFVCNNKLIGARFYNQSFQEVYDIQTELGEFLSPRDADGHGSHTASTAGGNADVAANANGFDVGFVSGMAPRARVAAYKVCWNSSYENPDGQKEAGCFYGDSMAAIDQAVADGVDVINFSIGGSRVNLTTPPAAAMLWAAEAGVFVAVSAGNSGPTASTIGTPAPWVTSVAASTYSGTIPSGAIESTIDGAISTMAAIQGKINLLIDDTGAVDESLVLAQPLLGCFVDGVASPLDNAAEVDDNIVLMSRGSCSFAQKLERAFLSGAKGALVFNNRAGNPIEMGGEGSFDLNAFMIDEVNGEILKSAIESESVVSVRFDGSLVSSINETGNLMAGFSSRGPNLSTADIIKPDITAPGVKVLAATTAAPMFGTAGQSFAYLQGTSMSSPHIAGMAALFKDSNPNWSPAQIKSALMTSARQNITIDGTEPATPFNFGAGHAQPVNAMDPGLLFDLGINDYLGFMCGQGNASFVSQRGVSCSDLEAAGVSLQASQLNLASIAFSELSNDRTVSRSVTNDTNAASTYTATIEAPMGIDISLITFDEEGSETPSDTLDVAADGAASFALTFSKNTSAVDGQWVFGSITWNDGAGHSVRLPIAVKPAPIVTIEVPELISADLKRGRASFPIKMLYKGMTSLDYVGLVPPIAISGNVKQDPDQSFSFNEAGLGLHFFHIPEGSKVVRFSLHEGLISSPDTDLDLYVYRCDKWSCGKVDSSTNGGSNEDIILVNPEPANDIGVGDVYLVWVHGWDVGGNDSDDDGTNDVDYMMHAWIGDRSERSTRISSSRRAIDQRYNRVSIRTKRLSANTLHMGAVTFYNEEGVAQGTTVLEMLTPE